MTQTMSILIVPGGALIVFAVLLVAATGASVGAAMVRHPAGRLLLLIGAIFCWGALALVAVAFLRAGVSLPNAIEVRW